MHLFGVGGLVDWFLTIYLSLTSNLGCSCLTFPRAGIAGVEIIPGVYISEVRTQAPPHFH